MLTDQEKTDPLRWMTGHEHSMTGRIGTCEDFRVRERYAHNILSIAQCDLPGHAIEPTAKDQT